MENNDLTAQLIERALTGEHSKDERINNYQEYLAAKEVCRAVYGVTNCFAQAADECIKQYLKTDDVAQLFLHRTMLECYEFYKYETESTQRLIEDYRVFLFSGNLLRSMLFGLDRRDYD